MNANEHERRMDDPANSVQQYVIEKGVPLFKASKNQSKYPFHKMDIGDSFVCDLHSEYMRKRISPLLTRIKKDTGKIFTVRKDADGNLRVWRIS